MIFFHTPMHVMSVITQGHVARDEWVTEYMVSYRLTDLEGYKWVLDENGGIAVSYQLLQCISLQDCMDY